MSEFDVQLKAIEKIAVAKMEEMQNQLAEARAALEAIRLLMGQRSVPAPAHAHAPAQAQQGSTGGMIIGPEKFVRHRTRIRSMVSRPQSFFHRKGCPNGSVRPATLQALTEGPATVAEIDKRVRSMHPDWRPSHSIYDQILLRLTREELVKRWRDSNGVGGAFTYELTEKGVDEVTSPTANGVS